MAERLTRAALVLIFTALMAAIACADDTIVVGTPVLKMIAMRDGVSLATDLYFPEGDGPWPVILMRTPYNKDGAAAYGAIATGNGYVLAAQDMRGRHASEGANLPFIACGWGAEQDGYDTIAWINSQPWCNGRIGTVGGSALGITQNLMAPTEPPGLVAQHIGVAVSSLYHQAAYQGGAQRKSQVEGWLTNTGFDPEALRLYQEHPDYDDFWRQFNIAERIEDINTPAVHIGGWFDTFCQGTLDSYVLRQHMGGEGARGRQWLVMGPWTHSTGDVFVGEVEFPKNAENAPGNPFDLWFDYWLKDIDNGIGDTPHVMYYTIGDLYAPLAPGNRWRFVDDWPVPATETPYYLHADGTLQAEPPAEAAEITYLCDPEDPVPTRGGRNLVLDAGMYDQRWLEVRDDVLVFSSAVLEEPLEVTGRLICRFWVSADTPNADVAVRFCDVYPDGRSMLIADGILRLSKRDGMERAVPMIPGAIYEVEVDLWSTSIIFNKEHQIRISVCGSNFPRWDLNPGTGEVWTDHCRFKQQNVTLHCGPQYPSALILPVVEQVEEW